MFLRKFNRLINGDDWDGIPIGPEDHAKALLEQEVRKIEDDLHYVDERLRKSAEEIAKLEQEKIFLKLQKKNLEKALEKFE